MEPWLQQAITALVTFSAAWGGVSTKLNGARADITEIKADVKDVKEKQSQHGERLASLESKKA